MENFILRGSDISEGGGNTSINDNNSQYQNIQPIKLIDEHSTTEFYIGTSNNGNYTSRAIWQIKKISKTSSVWNVTQFPDGDQLFGYVWNDRLTYDYV